MNPIHFEFDGGYIMVEWDQYEDAMEWYKQHMGWRFLEEEINHKMKRAAFVMPNGGHANFHTFREEDEHFSSLGLYEGNGRLCFQMADLEKNLAYFDKHRIRYSEPLRLPDGRETFDLYAYGDTRLTVIVDPEQNGRFPDARILTFSSVPARFGVRDVELSARWYERFLGTNRVPGDYPKGYAQLNGNHSFGGKFDMMWLEPMDAEQENRKANPHARIYWFIRKHEVMDFGSIPEGMINFTIPADEYAVCRFEEKYIGSFWGQICKEPVMSKYNVNLEKPRFEIFAEHLQPQGVTEIYMPTNNQLDNEKGTTAFLDHSRITDH